MCRRKVRPAVVADAPALGRVMVESWLSAHRGQVPDAVWQKRADEWTPEVSAKGWARFFTGQAEGGAPRDVLLVAEDDGGPPLGLVLGRSADEDTARGAAEIAALYVLPDRRGEGIGGALLRAAAGELATRGFTSLYVGVLTANLPARGFYEAMGGEAHGRSTFDEEGCMLPMTVYAWPDIAAVAAFA